VTDVTQERARAGAELPAADEQVLRELTERARTGGLKLTGEGGLPGRLTKLVIEGALEGELDDHLGYAKHDPDGRDGGNSRNGRRAKTVITGTGPVELSVPRDRDSSFEPKIVAKRQRRLTGVDDMVISLSAKGLTHGEIAAHLAEVYGAEVSRQTISTITDRVMEGMAEWQSRPLDPAWFPANVANYGVACWRSHRRMSWLGVLSLRQSRGRSLSSAATRESCSAVQICRSVPLGKYWRRRPLVFSLLPRCQGECGSAK
jgi:hypothetical protein